ncbi:MAG: hypothetical protein KA477_01475 [Candidatus Levybacteria bacterium]|nr:hypothetical protein [Candidatus Levybacteria bacterium]
MKDLESEIKKLRLEIDEIHARNRRVEADKAWELSYVRTGFIGLVTFLLVFIFLLLINDGRPFRNGILATLGYLLSSQTYGILKRFWIKKLRVKN